MKNVYLWSPSVQFRVDSDGLKIERFNYGKKSAEFFPEFYYYIQEGIDIEELKARFPENKRSFLNNLIRDFIKKKILVRSVISPKELFYSQSKLYRDDYDEEIKFVKEKLEAFKFNQTQRHVFSGDISYILEDTIQDRMIEERCSVREFDDSPVLYSDFSSLLGYLKNKSDNTRYYPSAGGLATLDIYVYVKKGRVDGVDEGLYYYDPVFNSIVYIEDGNRITAESQYITNKDIFNSSAFTVYFVYNALASMPKYGGMAYYYGIIECGIIISLLTTAGEKLGIGSCCIGDMYYEKILSCFRLEEHQVILQSMEFGIKKSL